jgi:hypothetical protein
MRHTLVRQILAAALPVPSDKRIMFFGTIAQPRPAAAAPPQPREKKLAFNSYALNRCLLIF